jgi:hypothetical protein
MKRMKGRSFQAIGSMPMNWLALPLDNPFQDTDRLERERRVRDLGENGVEALNTVK